MPNFIKRKLKIFAFLYFYFLVFAVIAVTLSPWWPFYQGLIIPKYVLLFGPRWWLLLVSLFIFVFWSYLGKKQRLFLPVLFIGVFNYLDFQLPSVTHYVQPSPDVSHPIKIIQANIGGGASMYEIKLMVQDEQPDILLLQEAKNIKFTQWVSAEYRTSCKGGLCIVSKLEFEEVGELNRKLINGWGNFAMLYKIKVGGREFSLANVHLETPRSVIMGFLHRYWDQSLANKTDSDRQYEALLISSWQQAQKNSIVVGDFNMLEDENIYQKYFSSMNNALGQASFGLNYTKRTSWHGVRIDHLLFSDNFTLKESKVLDAITGDHRPVVSTLSLKHEP
ncbi:endonuclease/exonuclease/phosphatase family protein [Thalassotalea piscium]